MNLLRHKSKDVKLLLDLYINEIMKVSAPNAYLMVMSASMWRIIQKYACKNDIK
jgi:hypothetical protein